MQPLARTGGSWNSSDPPECQAAGYACAEFPSRPTLPDALTEHYMGSRAARGRAVQRAYLLGNR